MFWKHLEKQRDDSLYDHAKEQHKKTLQFQWRQSKDEA